VSKHLQTCPNRITRKLCSVQTACVILAFNRREVTREAFRTSVTFTEEHEENNRTITASVTTSKPQHNNAVPATRPFIQTSLVGISFVQMPPAQCKTIIIIIIIIIIRLSRVPNFAAFLWLRLLIHVILFPMINVLHKVKVNQSHYSPGQAQRVPRS